MRNGKGNTMELAQEKIHLVAVWFSLLGFPFGDLVVVWWRVDRARVRMALGCDKKF